MKMEEKKKSKKIFLIPLFAILGVGLVLAGVYFVNSFTVQSDVYEPFTVQYAVLGDAGNYDGTTTCAGYTGTWTDYSTLEQPVDLVGLYAGESRKFCVKIDNAGEGDVPYLVQSEVVTGLGNYEDCLASFPEAQLTGTATGSSTTFDGLEFTVATDAPVVNDCQIEISVGRGELE
jgi:hypothetical protein